MAVLITKQDSNLSDGSNFYEVESHNLAVIAANAATNIPLTTTRYINTTFAHAGNALGIVLQCTTISMTSREIKVSLEQYQTVTSFTVATERINKVAHGLNDGDIVSFTTTGALPTGLSAGTQYYVVNKTADDFQVSLTLGGSAVLLSGTYSGTNSVGVQRATVTRTTQEITNGDVVQAGSTYKNRGIFIHDFVFTSSYAVDVTASKWRYRVAHGAGTGTWNITTSDATNPSYAAYCDNVKTFSSGNDCWIISKYLTIDQTATLSSVTSTGDATNVVSMWICSNTSNPAIGDVPLLKWKETPAASYTLTIPGNVFTASFSGIRIGYEQSATCTITNANPGVVTKSSHGLAANQMISFTSTGTLPNNLVSTQGFYYYVKTVLSADTFTVSATPGGAEIDTTGTQSGVHTLYWGRIPTAQKAILSFSGAATGVGNVYQTASNASYTYGGLSTFLFYGQLPKWEYTTLTAPTVATGTALTCADSVDWVNGDKVVIGNQNVKGQGDTAQYTINTVVGNTINLTGGVATYDRTIGGSVVRLGGHGVVIQSTASTVAHTIFYYAGLNLQVSGCDILNMAFSDQATTYYYYQKSVISTYRTNKIFKHNVCWTDTTMNVIFTFIIVPDLPMYIEYNYYHRVGMVGYVYGFAGSGFASSRLYVGYNRHIAKYTAQIGVVIGGNGNFKGKISMYNNVFENGPVSYAGVWLNGVSGEFYNNTFYGMGLGVYVGQYINPTRIENNSYDNCTTAIQLGAYVNTKCIENDPIFGATVANTYDVAYTADGLYDYTFVSPSSELVFDETYLPDTIPGSRVSIAENGGAMDHHETIYPLLKIHRSKAGLAYTIVRTAGGSAIMLQAQSGDDIGEWKQTVPTGNIQTQTMVFGAWIYINNANYYGGSSYQMPRLVAVYDGTTTIYSEAAKIAGDWQFLVLPVTPTTTDTSIDLSIQVKTDATGSDRDVYVDDMMALYPQGYKSNFGTVDDWALGLPVTPVISTGFNELGVWSASSTQNYGNDTMGELTQTRLVRLNTVASATSLSLTLDSGASSIDDFYNENYILIVSGTGSGQTRRITDYNGTSKAITINRAWSTNPTSTSRYAIIPFFSVDMAVWQASETASYGANTMGEFIKKLLSVSKFLGLK